MSYYGKDEFMDWATELGVEYDRALRWWDDGIVMTDDGIEIEPTPVGLPKFSEAWYKKYILSQINDTFFQRVKIKAGTKVPVLNQF